MVVLMAEALEFHEQWIRERPGDYGANVRSLIETSMTITAVNYVRAQRERNLMLAEALAALQDHAVLLAPSQATAAPKIDDRSYDMIANMVRFTGPFNATGQPVVSITLGYRTKGCRSRCESSASHSTKSRCCRWPTPTNARAARCRLPKRVYTTTMAATFAKPTGGMYNGKADSEDGQGDGARVVRI